MGQKSCRCSSARFTSTFMAASPNMSCTVASRCPASWSQVPKTCGKLLNYAVQNYIVLGNFHKTTRSLLTVTIVCQFLLFWRFSLCCNEIQRLLLFLGYAGVRAKDNIAWSWSPTFTLRTFPKWQNAHILADLNKGIHSGKLPKEEVLQTDSKVRIHKQSFQLHQTNHMQYPVHHILLYKEMILTGVSHLPVKLLSVPWQGGQDGGGSRNHPAVRILGA